MFCHSSCTFEQHIRCRFPMKWNMSLSFMMDCNFICQKLCGATSTEKMAIRRTLYIPGRPIEGNRSVLCFISCVAAFFPFPLPLFPIIFYSVIKVWFPLVLNALCIISALPLGSKPPQNCPGSGCNVDPSVTSSGFTSDSTFKISMRESRLLIRTVYCLQ